jgi:type I restriction enzyme S subunit
MSSDWPLVPLEDIAREVTVGYVGTMADEYLTEGVPFLRSLNIKPFEVDSQDLKFISQDFHKRIKKSALKPGDVAIVRTGKPGTCAVIPDWLPDANCSDLVLARCGPKIRPRFLCYWVNTLAANHISANLVGAVQQHFNVGAAKKMLVACPSLFEQDKVVELLGGLDDRITLLRETNATLEAIAQALFKSWFVDFDPVRAKMEGRAPEGMDEATAALFPDGLETSPLGDVPGGWKLTPLSQVFDINPTRTLRKGQVASYLDMASVATKGHRTDSPIPREMGSGSKFRNGDTLLARITPCLENGKAAFVDCLEDGQIGWGSTEFLVLRPRGAFPEYCAYLLCKHEPFLTFAIQSMVGTSGRQRIQNDALGSYLVAIPPDAIAVAFGDTVTAIQQAISANHEQSQTLAELRDTLLPRLISGQLRLPEAQEAESEACT